MQVWQNSYKSITFNMDINIRSLHWDALWVRGHRIVPQQFDPRSRKENPQFENSVTYHSRLESNVGRHDDMKSDR